MPFSAARKSDLLLPRTQTRKISLTLWRRELIGAHAGFLHLHRERHGRLYVLDLRDNAQLDRAVEALARLTSLRSLVLSRTQHAPTTRSPPLALAGLADNGPKGPNLAGIDPKTRKKVWLFHPRRLKWNRH